MEKAVLSVAVVAAPFLPWINFCLSFIMIVLFGIFCIQLWIVYSRCQDRKKRLQTIINKNQARAER